MCSAFFFSMSLFFFFSFQRSVRLFALGVPGVGPRQDPPGGPGGPGGWWVMTSVSVERVRRLISQAHDLVCSCGGGGPGDPGICEACELYHLLADQLREIEKEAEGGGEVQS